MKETPGTYDWVITKHEADKIREMIVSSFAHSGIPKIEVVDGNFENKGNMKLIHRWSGADLDRKYAEETMKHLYKLWGRTIKLETKVGKMDVSYVVRSSTEPVKFDPTVSPSSPLEETNCLIIE